MKKFFLPNALQVKIRLINVDDAERGEGNTDEDDDSDEPEVEAVPLVLGVDPGGPAGVDVPEGHDPHRKDPVDEGDWIHIDTAIMWLVFQYLVLFLL